LAGGARNKQLLAPAPMGCWTSSFSTLPEKPVVIESPTRREFTALVARPDSAVDLARASLLIACEEYPELDVPGYLEKLDRMGSAVRAHIGPGASPAAAVAALNGYLFDDEGFRGNTDEYYDPRNSFLNDVLDRRTGIPITLSMVYMEVARRAGLRVEGVGLPGHFIVKLLAPEGEWLIDPFHEGALLSDKDCQQRLDRIFGGRVRLEARLVATCGRKQMLARMLRNLKVIYGKQEDWPRALRVLDLLLRIDPGSAEDLRDRGIAYASLDCYGLAVRDLDAYLARAPRGPETRELEETVAALRARATRLH
jgi:regulator of sirC expression with transglutaminase-like and TPR domain